jgi:CRISPR-associated protein Csh1
MIEGIAAIGRSVLNDERGNDRFLAALSLPVRARGDSVPKLAILRYTRDGAQPGRIEAEWHELGPEEYEAWESRILWIGNNKGNKPQDRVTTTNLGYLIGQAIPTLAGKLPEKSALRAMLQSFLDDVYVYLEAGGKQRSGVWNPEAFVASGIESPEQLLADVKNKGKKAADEIAKAMEKAWGITAKSGPVLYTLQIGDCLVAEHPEYRAHLFDDLVTKAFDGAVEGVCFLTGTRGLVSSNYQELTFKYFINDKIGFAPGCAKSGFQRAYALSPDAYMDLMAGERFVDRHLRLNIAFTDCYLIPRAFTDSPAYWSDEITDGLKATRNRVADLFAQPSALREEMETRLEELEAADAEHLVIDILFYRRNNAEMRVLGVIHEVRQSRLRHLAEELAAVRPVFNRFGIDGERLYLRLGNMFYLFPIPKVDTKYDTGMAIRFYKRLIEGGVFSASDLIRRFVETVRVHRFEKYGAFIHSEPREQDKPYAVNRHLLNSWLLLLYLERLGQLQWEGRVTVSVLPLLEEYRLGNRESGLIRECLSDRPRAAACCLLGITVGIIASEQARQAEGDPKAKTILNKINYQGMNEQKVRALAAQLHEKIGQYLARNKGAHLVASRTLAAAHELLERYPGDELSATDHLYYILLGSAYAQFRRFETAGEQKETSEDDALELEEETA